jgi:hypothetical protein
MASKTLKAFIKDLPDFDEDILRALVADWNQETIFVLDDAVEKAPLAGGFLARSGHVSKRAKIGPNGISSSFRFDVPYASLLNEEAPKSKTGKLLELKEAGEVSYTIPGQVIKKQKKGEFAYATNAMKDAAKEDRFINIANRAISRAWRNL